MSYYIAEFDIGTDLEQPHNFVKINGMSPIFHIPMEYGQQPNYRRLYQWINATELGLTERFFDFVLTKREFQNVSTTTVIINSSTVKLTIEFLKNHISVKNGNAEQKQLKRKQLKRSLLILESTVFKDTKKTIRIFNLQNGSGELCIYSFLFKENTEAYFPL